MPIPATWTPAAETARLTSLAKLMDMTRKPNMSQYLCLNLVSTMPDVWVKVNGHVDLTPKPAKSKLLGFLERYISDNDGVSPSFREMREFLGLGTTNGSLQRALKRLEKGGFIRRMHNRARAIEIVRSVA